MGRDTLYCNSCGTLLAPGMNACPHCGTHVIAEEQAPTYRMGQVPGPYTEYGPSSVQAPPPPVPQPPLPTFSANPYQSYANPYTMPSTVPIQQPQPPTRGFPIVPVLVVSFLLLLLIGGGILSYTLLYHPAQTHTNTTPATSTQPPQNVYTQATSGTPLINDSLINSSNYWKTYQAQSPDNGGCTFANDGYHIKEATTKRFIYCHPETSFSDFAFQTQMTILAGDDGGMLFRINADTHQYYALRINTLGNYVLSMFTGPGKAQTLQRGSISSFKTGYNQTNLLALIARGSHLYVYVNKNLVTSVSDSSYTTGQIALLAEDDQHPTEIVYTHAQVWDLSS